LGALARPLVRGDGMTVKDLMEFLDVSRQNLTIILDRLEARDWIKRVKDKDDGRSRRIRLTRRGTSTWAGMQEPIEAFYSCALTTFSQEDQIALYRLLDRLKTALTKVWPHAACRLPHAVPSGDPTPLSLPLSGRPIRSVPDR